jgi:hypothetical protein
VHSAASAHNNFNLPILLFYFLCIINHIPVLIYSFSYTSIYFWLILLYIVFTNYMHFFTSFIHLRKTESLSLRWRRRMYSFFHGLSYIGLMMSSKTCRNYAPQNHEIFAHEGTPLYTLLKVIFMMRGNYFSRRLKTAYSTRVKFMTTVMIIVWQVRHTSFLQLCFLYTL